MYSEGSETGSRITRRATAEATSGARSSRHGVAPAGVTSETASAGVASAAAPADAATQATTPAATLIAHLGLEMKATAEIQDLYSRPARTTVVVPLVTGEHRVRRQPTADAA